MSRILIVEDDPEEVRDYYLEPLARLAAEKPPLNVTAQIVLLGHFKDQRLREFTDTVRRYPFAQFLERQQDHERDREAFLTWLVSHVERTDLAMIDRTVRGAEWSGNGQEMVVFNHARQSCPDKLRQIVLVSFLPRVDWTPEAWELHDSTLPKFRDLEQHYSAFKRFVSRRLTNRWSNQLKQSGKDFEHYVDRAGDEVEHDLAACATLALKGLLSVQRGAPSKLSEAVPAIRRTFFDPSTGGQSRHVRSLDGPFHVKAIRRRVLYGLQQTWRAFSRKTAGDRDYEIWIEVIAAGYHCYHAERAAARRILQKIREGGLSVRRTSRPNEGALLYEFDLDALDVHYESRMGKQPRIVRAAAFEDDRDLARIDSRNICRFFEGDLEFKRTPHYRRIPTDKFRVNFGGKAGRVPGVNASEADWSAFWKKLQPSIPGIVRTGHTEVVAKALTDELWFKDQDAAFGIQPTLSEEAWWSDVMPDIQALVEEQTRRTFRHQPYWDPNAQSTERDRVALPPAPDDTDGDAGASGEPPADAD